MMRFFVLLLSFISAFSTVAQSHEEVWTLSKEKNGIKVYTRKSIFGKLKDSKSEMTVQASREEVMKEFLMVDQHTQWMDRMIVSKMVKKNSDRDFYAYYEAHAPWPVSNRDMVIHYQIFDRGKVTEIVASAKPDFMPKVDGKVRIPRSESVWLIESISPKLTKITFISSADPGGQLPEWLVNSSSTDNPFNSLSSLRSRIQP